MARVTVRYFKISKNKVDAPDLAVALKDVFGRGARASQRQREVDGSTYRLERLDHEGTCIEGEIVRKQTDDIPPEANDKGLSSLSLTEGGGIGHCIAFRFNTAINVMAIQFDNRAVSINRLLAYIQLFDALYDYRADPIVREDAWDRYRRGSPRKLELSIAAPDTLAEVEGDVDSVVASTKRLSEISGGPVISIQIGMGRRDGSLQSGWVNSVLRHFTTGSVRTADVRKLTVTTDAADGGEQINFLQEFLRDPRDLTLPEGDPDRHYSARRGALKSSFDMNLDYLQRVYGGSRNGQD